MNPSKQERQPTATPRGITFEEMPDTALVRQHVLVRSRNHPSFILVLPISSTTLWVWIGAGHFPKPLKLSAKTTAWRVGDVRQWLRERAAEAAVQGGAQ